MTQCIQLIKSEVKHPSLPEIQLTDRQRLENFFADSNRLSRDHARACVDLYIRWLRLLIAYPEYDLAPSKDIDEVWHYHILDTKNYISDCDKFFGRYLHHTPYAMNRESFQHMKQLWELHYCEKVDGEPSMCDK